MALYIALLRGINVSGQKIIRMEALRKTFESLGFGNVATYLQSGNVIFTCDSEYTGLEEKISRKIVEDFGFDVPVIVLSAEKFTEIAGNNPFTRNPDLDPAFFHVTFLAQTPRTIDIPAITSRGAPGELIELKGNVVYLYCPGGYGITKLSNTFLESRLGVKSTTRNWKTVLNLVASVTGDP
jgi:uncharacterized protein (DUF1697 family)